jgi:hypothetical protein
MGGRLLGVAVAITVVGAISCARPPSGIPLPGRPEVVLCRDRTIQTRPFVRSAVGLRDAESIVHVDEDDTLWIGDDNSNAVFELDRSSGRYRSRITARNIVDAFPGAGRCDDGDENPRTRCSYTEELEVVAYDSPSRTLYVFNTVNKLHLDPPVDKPAMFRLERRSDGRGFRLAAWQELPGGRKYGPAVVIDEKLYLAIESDVVEYDVKRNRLRNVDYQGNPVALVSTTEGRIVGMAFDGSSLWLLTHIKKLVQIDWESKAALMTLDIAPFGISKAKGLGFGAGEFFVVEGDRPNPIHVLRFGAPAKTSWWRGGEPHACG